MLRGNIFQLTKYAMIPFNLGFGSFSKSVTVVFLRNFEHLKINFGRSNRWNVRVYTAFAGIRPHTCTLKLGCDVRLNWFKV